MGRWTLPPAPAGSGGSRGRCADRGRVGTPWSSMTTSRSSPVRLRDVLGDELLGVYAGGSYALGAYEPGRSDIDVNAVVTGPLAPRGEAGDRRARPPRGAAVPRPRPRARRLPARHRALGRRPSPASSSTSTPARRWRSASTSSPARSRASGSRSTARSCAQHGARADRAAGRGAVRADPARRRCSRCSPSPYAGTATATCRSARTSCSTPAARCASRPRGRGRPSARRARGPRASRRARGARWRAARPRGGRAIPGRCLDEARGRRSFRPCRSRRIPRIQPGHGASSSARAPITEVQVETLSFQDQERATLRSRRRSRTSSPRAARRRSSSAPPRRRRRAAGRRRRPIRHQGR